MVVPETCCHSFYVILSGLFCYHQEKINLQCLERQLLPWSARINNGNYKSTFDYLNSSYYDSYVLNIFPETRKDFQKSAFFKPGFLNHYTLKDCIIHPEVFSNIQVKSASGETFLFDMEFIDVYLFPHSSGIFSVKMKFPGSDQPTVGKISGFLNKIRATDCKFIFPGGRQESLSSFLGHNVLNFFQGEIDILQYNPQFKLYSNIDLAEEINTNELDSLLYDIGSMSPIGTAMGNGTLSPAPEYYHRLISGNTIKIFKNWTALSLYDTFTRISCNYPDQYKSWEYDYFHVYIYALYMKFYIYVTNSKLSDVTVYDRKTHRLRNEFIEFMNDYHHTQISYKFLPDAVKDKILYSLDIQLEMEKMETKINRINSTFQEKRENQMNIILSAITILSIISFVKDTSDWLVLMGMEKSVIYPSFSMMLQALIILLLVGFYVYHGKKKS